MIKSVRWRIATLLLCLAATACPHDRPGHGGGLPPDVDNLPAPASPPALVAIMIADTTDHGAEPGRTIAPGVKANLQNMRAFARSIASRTGLAYHETIVQGDDQATPDPFNCEAIEHTLRAVTAGPDDTVLIYYSGHGFNVADRDAKLLLPSLRVPEDAALGAWRTPYMYCGGYGGAKFGTGATAHNPNEADAVRWAKATGARLVVAIFDSCNSYLEVQIPPGATSGGTREGPEPDARDMGLFRTARGTVILAGTSPGTYGFYLPYGGLFTGQFLNALASRDFAKPATWSDMLPDLLLPINTISEGSSNVQQPIAQLQDATGTWLCAGTYDSRQWQKPCEDLLP